MKLFRPRKWFLQLNHLQFLVAFFSWGSSLERERGSCCCTIQADFHFYKFFQEIPLLLFMTGELVAMAKPQQCCWYEKMATKPSQKWHCCRRGNQLQPPASMTRFEHLILDDSAGLCPIPADLLHDLLHAPARPVNQSIVLMWDQC